jgi:peptidoglycan/xylan/chitin deacetylase (PgdA/CDA1 family)
VGLTSTPDPIPVDSSRGYIPADLIPVDIVYTGQTSGTGSRTWTGSSTADTSDYIFGSESRSLTTAGTGALISFASTLGSPLNMTGKFLVVWIKQTNLSHALAGYPRIFLGDAALTNAYYWQLTSSVGAPYNLDGEWLRVSLPFGMATVIGAPSRASLATLTVQWADDNTGNACTFKLAGVVTAAEPAQWPNGVVSISFDDGYLAQYTFANPYMDHYAFRGTLFLITETLWNHGAYPGYMSLQQVQALELNNWEASTHAHLAANHNAGYVAIGDAAAFNDMVAAKSYLVQQGFRAPEQFAYPLGVYQSGTFTSVLRLFGTGRTITYPASGPDETFPPANLSRLRALAVTASTTVATVQNYITAAKNNKEWLILCFHDFVASGATGNQILQADFQTIIDFINTTGIPVRPISEVLKSG